MYFQSWIVFMSMTSGESLRISRLPDPLPFHGHEARETVVSTENDNRDDNDDGDDTDDDNDEINGTDIEINANADKDNAAQNKPDGTPKDKNNISASNGDSNEPPKPPRNVCPHYAKSKCRYGMSGNGCSKNHPRPCRKLLRHGPKSKTNPEGCPGLPACTKWHPVLCRASVRNKECTYEGCKFRHVAGTRKGKNAESDKKRDDNHPRRERNHPDNKPASSLKSTEDHFLEMLEKMKKELMDSVETRLRLMTFPQMPYHQMYPPGMYQFPLHHLQGPAHVPVQSTVQDQYSTTPMTMGFPPQMSHQQVVGR